MTNEEYKQLSIKEFTEAAKRYEGDHAGLYEMCKKDYPDILEELEKEPFIDLLKDIKSGEEKGWFTLENQEKLFEAGIVVFKLVLKRIKK